ncbi:MAG: glycosyltransferase family 4 protein [Clostridia bacterium]|nr:glycosyltransferase family 4 protein [Clostridia bacterium]
MKKIMLIGAFGNGTPTTSGQIIRTNITYNELIKRYGKKNVLAVNTSESRIKCLAKLVWHLFRVKDIMVILSSNGMRVMYPILEKTAKLFGKKVLNSVVGGTIKPILRAYPKCREAMKSFNVNWVQLPDMVKELEADGIYNGEVLPNAKPLKLVTAEEMKPVSNPPYKFCTFSRISKEKGIEDAIEAVKKMNENGVIATLDIYGAPDENYIKDFEKIMSEVPKYITYCGVAEYDKTSDLLKDYYMLLFPTTFDGEGFPGTLIDAMFAGLPVIATDWRHNGAVITDGQTGYLYDYKDKEKLPMLMEKAILNPETVYGMREKCLKEAEKYTIERAMDIICKRIDG